MKKLGIFINSVALIVSLIMFGSLVNILLSSNITITFNMWYIVLGFISYCILHIIKMVRYYLILSEAYIPIYDFIKLYIRFSLVNILIPHKIGEFYKLYAIGERCNNYKIAFLSIITQIYFDLISISLILVINLIIFKRVSTLILILFLLSIVMGYLIYIIFPSTYKYLNTYFILKKSKKRDIYALDFLCQLNSLYEYQRDILKGKGGIILIISLAIWVVEYFVFFFISKIIGLNYNLDMFSKYISNILVFETNSANVLLVIYTVIGSIIFAMFFIGVVLLKLWRGAER